MKCADCKYFGFFSGSTRCALTYRIVLQDSTCGKFLHKKSTLFMRCTESVETLANATVYQFVKSWTSPFISETYPTREEAVQVTINELSKI